MSIDEREDPDDEEEVVADGVPIVASNEIIDSYGGDFEFYVNEHNVPDVRPAQGDAQRAPACRVPGQAQSMNEC